ncbi:hypothetical protein [Microscilla marina]|uniref:Uncharacterized protein n=1 Tax=Microscilla marina ATCC 23134 TaxID=313606 RepID=A1ZTT1_MICM2|nr:hypothetical protein [Microscilla marina]EAY26183.1 hypothetical protein M23134_02515 [Microscilla marina ATCC 23134]
MKQVIGFYRKTAWTLLVLGIWIVIGYCIRLARPHPHTTHLVINMLALGGSPIGIALWMFRNLKKEKRRK